MKAIENEKSEKTTLKKLQNSRQIEKQKFLVIPDQSTADYERQLRKLATRGSEYIFFPLQFLPLIFLLLQFID